MALRYYDDIISAKIKAWMPTNSELRVLRPDEAKRFFETQADDSNDKNIKLPCITLSRNTDIELIQNIKNVRSFDGLRVERTDDESKILNSIPVKLTYQLDIFAKTYEEADEYLRQYLFKLINNPKIRIDIPYNNSTFNHVAYIRVLSNVSDTSAISERLFSGQFTRWTLNLEIIDAHLFSIAYKDNWKIYYDEDSDPLSPDDVSSFLQLARDVNNEDTVEDSEILSYRLNKTDK